MLPQNPYPTISNDAVEMPSRTYKLDTHQKRIIGYVDDLDAMVQAIQKIFETERFAWQIYTHEYGIELESLLGQEQDFVITVLESRIKDALLSDDRIIELQDFQVTQTSKDTLTASGHVITTHGTVELREEIRL